MKERVNFSQDPYFLTRRKYSEVLRDLKIVEEKMRQYYPGEFLRAAHGDWRENSPKDVLDHAWSLDIAELNRLRSLVGRSVVIEDLLLETDTAAPGLEVVILDLEGNQRRNFTLVSFTDVRAGYLSVDSNLGKALIGKRTGECVEVQGKQVKTSYRIEDIRRPAETTPIEITDSGSKEKSARKMAEVSQVVKPETGTLNRLNETREVVRPVVDKKDQISGQKKIDESRLVSKEEEQLLGIIKRVNMLGGRILADQTLTRDLNHGKKESRRVVEFIINSQKFRAELIIGPNVLRTQYGYSRRPGSSAELINVYGDEIVRRLLVCRLEGNHWVRVDFRQ